MPEENVKNGGAMLLRRIFVVDDEADVKKSVRVTV